MTGKLIEQEKKTHLGKPVITAKNGLLYRYGKVIDLPEADQIAREYGYQYAEQFVKALQPKKI
jgi:hypothetical protein